MSNADKEIIENMSDEELNEFVFFIAQTMTEKYEELKAKIDKLKNKLKEDKEKMQSYYDDNEMNYYKQIDYILKILEG